MKCPMNTEANREKEFEKLVDSVANCTLCSNMSSRTGVLSELNGNIYSNVLFVAEAPGRLGADKTRIPLFGDQTGANFQKLIDTVGWSREDFFITNAVLCNPRNENGNNATPGKQNIYNCAIYLRILIEIMNPEYIVTIGQKALEAVDSIHNVNIRLRDTVRSRVSWNGRTLIPLYHMGPRALIHRNFYNQLADFYWLKNTVKLKPQRWEKLNKLRIEDIVLSSKFYPSKFQKLVVELLDHVGTVSKFKLTKLIYLTDYEFLKNAGKLLSNSFYLRAYEGPLPMGMDKQLDELRQRGLISNNSKGYLRGKGAAEFSLSNEEKSVLKQVLMNHGHKTDEQIKTATYLTKPMKRILRVEKGDEQSMLWKPVFTEEDFQRE